MISEGLETLLAVQLAVALGVVAVLALRVPVRAWFGPRLAFSLWALPVVAAVAVLTPGPIQGLPVSDPVLETATEAADIAPPADGRVAVEPGLASDVGVEGPVQVQPINPALTGPVWIGVWGVGAVIMALVLAVRQYRYHVSLQPMQPAPELGADIFRAGSSDIGAGLIGAARPRIVVPADFEQRFSGAERDLILDHEREHRRAGHAQFNAIAALMQTLCWMNPLVHIGLRWFRLDQELACDAAILQRSQQPARLYGTALLRAQTGAAAPFGCTWRPAHGLKTRIKALGGRVPSTLTRAVGGASLVGLIAGVGAVAWAARPEMQSIEPALTEHASANGGMRSPSSGSALTRVELRGVDGQVRIIAEPRTDVAVEDLAGNILTRRDGSTLIVQVSDLTLEVCNRSEPVTQSFTLRVPDGVHVDIEGRMNARLDATADISLGTAGCGTVNLGDVTGALNLDLGGSVAINAGEVDGGLTLISSGGPSVDVTRVGGPIELRTAGGTAIDIEAVEAGGRFQLSGGSTLDVEAWTGPLRGGLSGGSDADIEAIVSPRAEISVSGSASGDIETGQIGELRVEQAATADFTYGGRAERSRVRNRGDAPVVIAYPGVLDSQGRVRTAADPPSP